MFGQLQILGWGRVYFLVLIELEIKIHISLWKVKNLKRQLNKLCRHTRLLLARSRLLMATFTKRFIQLLKFKLSRYLRNIKLIRTIWIKLFWPAAIKEISQTFKDFCSIKNLNMLQQITKQNLKNQESTLKLLHLQKSQVQTICCLKFLQLNNLFRLSKKQTKIAQN